MSTRPPRTPSRTDLGSFDVGASPRAFTTSAMSDGRRASFGTPGSINRSSRNEQSAERRLWQMDTKLIDQQAKLTSANLELAKMRAAAETHQQEMSYTRRLLEREKRERAPLEAELAACREQLRAAKAKGLTTGIANGDTAATGERVMLLKAQLEEAGDRSKAFAAEAERLRDEVGRLKQALDQKGEAGQLRKELSAVKEERVRLALELHDAKATAGAAKADAGEARQQLAGLTSLRASLNESIAGRDMARKEVERLSKERAASLEEHGLLLQQAKGMAEELDACRASQSQLSEQKMGLVERLHTTEQTLASLRAELAKREEDFQVDLGLFSQRDEQQRNQIDKQAAENRAAAVMIEELQRSLQEVRGHNQELVAEVDRLQQATDAGRAQIEQLESGLRDTTARADATELELRRDRQAHADHSERTDTNRQQLAERLESALNDLRSVSSERDRLSATLEEALTRCTSSLVAKQLAEDDCRAAQQQLDAYRAQYVS